MRLVKETIAKEGNQVVPSSEFRLYDDNNELMKYVKSVSFRVSGEEPFVTMVIERYVVSMDEIDVSLADDDAQILPVKVDKEADENSL